MRAPSHRIRRIVPLAVAPLAILLAGAFVWQGSTAAFTAQTRSIGNSWETGAVSLTDDDAGSARFQVTGLTPMATGTKCIKVTSTSSVPGVVKLFIEGLGSQGLQDYLHVVITKGDGGNFGSCTGFVADSVATEYDALSLMATEYTNFATGTEAWSTAGVTSGESKTYQFTWTFDTSTLTQTQINALQGQSTSATFVWELQSS
jgi:hypothetical protein